MEARTYITLTFCLLLLHLSKGMAQNPIKIEYLRSKPIVAGEINGRKAYFLLDTGSDMTVLHERKASYYNFKVKKMMNPQKIMGISGRHENVNRAGNINLALGELPIISPYFTYDLSGIISSIYRKNSVKISGIIGSDVMIKYGFVIDYNQKLVHYDASLVSETNPVNRKE